ncbi:MAG: hypothetical protein M3Y08_05885 [Fibrobacterota bacterium]|nr:hypothetical protein [Fibrobacterota bacterium]
MVELLLILTLASAAWSAPRRGGTGKTSPVDRPVPKAAVETVYVQVAPARPSPSQDSRLANESSRESDARRKAAQFSTGPTRNYSQAYGLYLGTYTAELLGTNPYANFFWDLYPDGQAFFFEFTLGGGTVQSGFSESIIGQRFDKNYLVTFEALGGYSLSGLTKGNGRGGGLFPYFVAGITAVYQGGVPNFGGALGFGNRTNLPFGPKNSRYALNYGIRDHIYSPNFGSHRSLTQNPVLLVGVQKYF